MPTIVRTEYGSGITVYPASRLPAPEQESDIALLLKSMQDEARRTGKKVSLVIEIEPPPKSRSKRSHK